MGNRYKNKSEPHACIKYLVRILSCLVPETGLEPVRCCHHGILSPGRLPVPPLGQIKKPMIITVHAAGNGLIGGTTRTRTGGKGFAGPCLTAWLWCHDIIICAARKDRELNLERKTRFELATFALARQRSTTEPLPHGGSYRARTCDPLLVRQMLSQLS